MQLTRKIIYWTSLGLILLFIMVSVLENFTPLEFTNNDYQDLFEEIQFWVLPIAILLTLFGTLKSKDSAANKGIKIALTISISILTFFFLFMLAFNMCAWTTDKTLFYNTNNKASKIVLRDFGCGATDSGYPTYKVCKIRNISPLFIWVTGIDTTKIDKQIWLSVENK